MPIAQESPDQPDVIPLIGELDAYQDSLYPPEARYALDLASLMQPNVRFVVARDARGAAIGCGAVVLAPGHGELKRMYVQPSARGSGVAQCILRLAGSCRGGRGMPGDPAGNRFLPAAGHRPLRG